MFGDVVIHHSHVTGEIIGYAHNFCNKKVRETQNQIPVFAHNLFSFDLFCCKGNKALCLENKITEYRWYESY